MDYNDIWTIITKILKSHNNKYLIKHHIDSYDYFLDYEIKNIINDSKPIKIIKKHNENNIEILVKVINHKYGLPTFYDKDGRKNILLPENARNKKLTYSLPLYLDFEIQTIYLKDEKIENIKKNKEENIFVGNIPLMVHSKYCLLEDSFYSKNVDECEYDMGGYFIISGNDKVIISQERMTNNKIYNFKTDSGKYSYISEVRCNKNLNQMANVFRIKFLGDKNLNGKCTLYCSFSNLKDDIPLLVLFKYFGVSNDKEIIKYILYDYEKNIEKYTDYINLLKNSFIDFYENHNDISPENYIKKFFINKNLSVKYIIDEKVLNMYDTNEEKLFYLGYMIKQFLDVILKKKEPTDRDNFENKRIETTGILFTQLFRNLYNNCMKSIKSSLQKEVNPNFEIHINKYIKTNIIENGLRKSLATGNWNSKIGADNKKIGIAQMFNRLTYSATLSHLRRINAPVGSNGKMILPRKLHNSQFGFFCAAESPEGAQIGLVKNLSLSTIITTNSNKDSIIFILNKLNCLKIDKNIVKNSHCKIFINNVLLYLTDNPIEVYNILKQYKTTGKIEYTISIIFKYSENIIKINTEEGRVLRPFLTVKNNKININKNMIEKIKKDNFTFDELVLNNIIEYIDLEEQNNIMICDNIKNLKNKYVKYTHCEIHPSLILGVCASLIPFPDHNQSPRNTYQSAMGKQSIGYSLTNYNNRMDSFNYILHYPQRPIVYTRSGNLLGFNDLPAGDNLVIAIACHTGYNQEDSVIVNRGAIERGLFNITFYRTYKTEEKKDMTSLAQEKFCIPDRDKCIGIRKSSYEHLDTNGLIKLESKVKGNDVIIGKITPITDKQFSTSKKDIKYKDTSVQLRHNEDGIVDKVSLDYNNDGYRIASVKVRSTRSLEMADKISSRHGQKGTLGLILDEEDMPFTEDGIVPDVIINPHAIPSRMTIAQLIECVMGKIGSMTGRFFDGTPFEKVNIENLMQELDDLGFENKGYETLYNGETGDKIKSKIFIGPTFYQRLKHMVKDKIHARARGPNQILTRQPSEGRSRGGGLRLGEMETDCILSHGLAYFLKEKTFDCSDHYDVFICNNCGIIGIYNEKKNIYECRKCNNKSHFYKINLPYSTKLLLMEIESMNVNTKFIV